MAITDNKIINGSGLSELSSQIKSYVNSKIVDEVYVGDTAPTDPKAKLWVDTSAEPSNNSYTKSEIDTKLTQKQDTLTPGDNITIVNGVISSTASGSAEPDAYIKDASVSGNTLTLTKKDDTEVVFTPAGGSSGGVVDAIDWSKVQNKPNFANVATSGDYNDLSNKPTIPSVEGLASETYVNEKVAAIVIPEVPTKVSELENDKGYLTEHQSLAEYAKKTEIPAPYTLPTASTSTLGGVKVDGNTITIADGVISAKSGGGGGGSGEWHYTTNYNESDLYNAKELVIFYQQTSTMKLFCEHYVFVKQDGTQGTLGADFSNQYFGMFYRPDTALWNYNGSHFDSYNLSYKWQVLAYKT